LSRHEQDTEPPHTSSLLEPDASSGADGASTFNGTPDGFFGPRPISLDAIVGLPSEFGPTECLTKAKEWVGDVLALLFGRVQSSCNKATLQSGR